MESDAPVPYGRILPLPKPIRLSENLDFKEKFELLVPNAKIKRRDVLVAILSSNCFANKRYDYVRDLQKFIKVDFYGGCAPEEMKSMCPWRGYGTGCEHLKKYLFYLSLENANCKLYMTEKIYSHALESGAVPVYMGMYQNQSDTLFPPNSYIHTDNFKNPEALAKYLLHLNDTLEENYLQFHEWRRHFESVSESGYVGARSYHYCRLCEALNYNDEAPKVYQKEDLAVFLDPVSNCHEVSWTN